MALFAGDGPTRVRKAFAGRVALVTGAASGIGLALARQLAAAGARVTLVDRDGDTLERLLPTLPRARVQALDVTDADGVHAAVAACVEAEGRLDLMINNAGIGVGGEVMDLDAEQWRRIIEVNLFGVVHGVRAAWPIMRAQGGGHIANVASLAGLFPLPGESAYAASKYGAVGLGRVLRIEGADLGIRVTTVCPGRIDTPIYDTSPLIGFDKDAVLRWWPKGITAERCAATILDGIARNRGLVVVTGHARALYALSRVSDRLTEFAGRRYMRLMRRYRTDGDRE